MQRAFAAVTARLPHGWGDLGRQIGLVLVVNTGYEIARGIADGQKSVAFAHGRQVIDAERVTGTFFEPGLQALFLPVGWLMDFANQVYMNSQFAVVLAFFVWLYFFRNESFYFVRNMFAAAMGLALIGYVLYPTAPPRMFPEYGFVDTINDYSSVNHDSALAKLLINPYAAVPSLHCAFALMIGATGFQLVRGAAMKAFWAAWPLLVAWVVVVTGNHYWIDVVLGWAVAVGAALVARELLARARPEKWSWRVGAAAPAAREAEA